MRPSKDITDKVHAEVERCIKIAVAHYGRTFGMPGVSYDLRGRSAGTANHRRWVVRLNTILLEENQDEMIYDTVPHEVAHLIDFEVNPRAWGARREPHGESWKVVMRLFGVEPTRTHKMDTTNSRVRLCVFHEYACPVCAVAITVGPRQHTKMLRGMTFRRKACGHAFGISQYVGITERSREQVAARAAR